MGIEKKGVGKNPCIYLVQSVVNYNGFCIGSDIRCLPKIHESSIIQTELYSSPLCPAVGKKQTCVQSPDVWWSLTKGAKEGDTLFVQFHIFRLWIQFLSVFYGILMFYLLLMPLSPYLCIAYFLTSVVIPPFSFEWEEKMVKVMAGNHLIMLSSTVMRWAFSPRLYYRGIPQRLVGNFWQD